MKRPAWLRRRDRTRSRAARLTSKRNRARRSTARDGCTRTKRAGDGSGPTEVDDHRNAKATTRPGPTVTIVPSRPGHGLDESFNHQQRPQGARP